MRHPHLIIGAACALLAACQGQKPFVIKTTPPGATVSINGKEYAGKTPLEVEIAQDKDLGIVVHKDGYAVESATVNTQTSWLGSLLWTESSPHARYIEEDEITIPLRRLETNSTYTPTILTPFSFPEEERNPLKDSKPPALRPLPEM
ncbi:MAG: PEGA domain-containing protein [Akkermansia sp.]|nr:PEGA domain-containing protein [Akkermansia sp.]MBR3945425.1 PEGA domain-containing protein [Akkermansia sp.]MBR7109474.1 PEGA domain-containing protein [Akkermansia sp.]